METNINRDLGSTTGQVVERDSWKDMFNHLYADMNRLLERERVLFRTEVNVKFSEAKKAVGSLVVGGACLLVGFLALVATAIIALDYVMPLWGAAALVTAIFLVTGFILVSVAKKKLNAEELKPNETLETLGEFKTTFKETINEYRQQHH